MSEIEEQRLSHDQAKANGTDEIMPATHGHFSSRFYNQIYYALKKAPGLMEHMVSLIAIHQQDDDRVDVSKTPPLPFNQSVFNDANELYQFLVFWAQTWADRLGKRGPTPAQHAWRNMEGKVLGLPANIDPSTAKYQTAVMSSWLEMHLLDVLWLVPGEDVYFFRDQMRDIYTLAAKYPVEMRPRYSQMPCPDCMARIVVYPPQEFEDDQSFVCEGCHRWFQPDQYSFFVRLFEQQQKEQMSGSRVMNHLVKKYGS